MYKSFPEASEQIAGVLVRTKKIPQKKERGIREMIKRALEVDTGRQLHRADFLSPDRVQELVEGKALESTKGVVKTIFPRTWKLLENTE